MFKFFILIYLFAISSYSQTVIRKVIVKPVIEQVQQEEEDISQIEQETEDESPNITENPIASGVTVDSCGLNRIDAKTYDNKIIGGEGYYKTKKLLNYWTAGVQKMNNKIEK